MQASDSGAFKRYFTEPLYAETHRQQFHFSPARNWMNDPNGMVYYNGEYHLFYQYNPNGVDWGDMSWGHSVSTDLVHWQELAPALRNDDLGYIFSGSCVVDAHNTSGLFDETGAGLVAFYTLHGETEQQSLAYSTDSGRTWTKYNGGRPVITSADDPTGDKDFRDPKVFWLAKGNCWIMVLAGGPLRIYSSQNLIDWKFESSYAQEMTLSGTKIAPIVTECPDLFRLPVPGADTCKWVLNGCGRFYLLGALRSVDGRWYFIPDDNRQHEMNFGPDAYAAQTYSNAPDGRVIMINWMSNWSYCEKTKNWTGKFNGAMTLQTELFLKDTPDGLRLAQRVIPEMDVLQTNTAQTCTEKDCSRAFATFSAETYLLEIRLQNMGNDRLAVELFSGDVLLCYEKGELKLSREKTALQSAYCAQLPVDAGDMNLKIYVDKASVEVFANGGLCVGSFLIFGASRKGLNISLQGHAKLSATATVWNGIWGKK